MSPTQIHDFVNSFWPRSRSGLGLALHKAARTQLKSYSNASWDHPRFVKNQNGAGNSETGLRGGLASMKEQVRLINGSLSIHSAPGQGTVIEIQAPLAGKDRV